MGMKLKSIHIKDVKIAKMLFYSSKNENVLYIKVAKFKKFKQLVTISCYVFFFSFILFLSHSLSLSLASSLTHSLSLPL